MAAKKSAGKSAQSKKRSPQTGNVLPKRILLALAAVLLGSALILGVFMSFAANIVQLHRVEVPLDDLPAAFDGVTILFVSELHLDSFNTPNRVIHLMDQLQATRPDILLLGGDYTHRPLWEMLSPRGREDAKDREELERRRNEFFQKMLPFQAPMLKAGVPGNHDRSLSGLDQAMASGGFELLSNRKLILEREGQQLAIVGLDDWDTGERDERGIAQQCASSECVIVVSHTPDVLPVLNNQPGLDGTGWIDLMLSSHTHGGQLRVGDWTPFNPSMYGKRFLTGWHLENNARLLVSNGVGTSLLPMRLGAPPQAHLITLRCGQRGTGGEDEGAD